MHGLKLYLLFIMSVWLLSPGPAGPPAFSGQTRTVNATVAPGAAEFRTFLDQYCISCHNQNLKTAGLMLDKLDVNNVAADAGTWEKVVIKLRAGMMPPVAARRPDQATYGRSSTWLEGALNAAAAAHPNPGATAGLHRLNRTEYANVIRDLLDVSIDVAPLLPPDDPLYGFDNIADSLGVTPILMERYLSAADKVSALAVGDPDTGTTSWFFRVRQDLSQDRHVEGLPLGTVGGIAIKVTLPLDGEYVVQPKLFRTNLGVMRGLESTHELEVAVDGERAHLGTFGGYDDFKNELENQTKVGDDTDAKLRVRVPIKAGPHIITVAFLKKSDAAGTLRLQPFIRSSADTIDITGHPHLDTVLVTGPYNPTGPGDTPSRRIFTCRPATNTAQAERRCATTIVSTIARRAFRRPVTAAEVQRLMNFYDAGRKDGSFEHGVQTALYRILASPNFVFRAEVSPDSVAAGTAYRISDVELASRLSFFLWSSIPDDELLNLAIQNRLHTPAILAQQVKRMTSDPRFALVENFAGQWLYLRNLKNQVPDSNIFPDFDDNLRQAFKDETEMFVASIIKDDRSVLDLMTADYTFVNERLARHYGIPNIYGSQMRRVQVPMDERRGLLGKGAILMVTSHVDRTSPVVRGKWILENLLGAPPPMPPPNVPPLSDNDAAKPKTMRERMEVHRENPVCSSCHRMMDPVGFSMENFDAVGTWRDKDGGNAIDASGQLVDGRQINGVVALRNSIVERPDLFLRTITTKLMTYGLGRGLQPYDMPVVRGIVRDASKTNYKFSAILNGIIGSSAFQMRMKPLPENDRPAPNTRAAAQ